MCDCVCRFFLLSFFPCLRDGVVSDFLCVLLCSEINSNTYWTNAEQKQAMVAAERKFVDDKVKK